MSAEPARHLRVVDTDTGELFDAPVEHSEAIALARKLETQIRMMERDLAGKRLRIAELEADREQEAEDHPLRPQVDAVHACWRAATGKRRPLHFSDVFAIAAAINKLGFDTCLRAIAGARYEPHTRRLRNGTQQRYDDLELIFRNYGKVTDFAARAPRDFTPDPEKVAAIAQVPIDRARNWLGATS